MLPISVFRFFNSCYKVTTFIAHHSKLTFASYTTAAHSTDMKVMCFYSNALIATAILETNVFQQISVLAASAIVSAGVSGFYCGCLFLLLDGLLHCFLFLSKSLF